MGHRMFGYTIIKKEDLEDFKKAWLVRNEVHQCYRWLSGFKDLDLIWDYLLGKWQWGGISAMRDEYAKLRGTDRYGKPLEDKPQ